MSSRIAKDQLLLVAVAVDRRKTIETCFLATERTAPVLSFPISALLHIHSYVVS